MTTPLAIVRKKIAPLASMTYTPQPLKCKSWPTWRQCAAWIRFVVPLLALSVVGCQSVVYKASNLPPEFRAAPVNNLESLDLTQIKGKSIRRDQIYDGDMLEITVVSGDFEEEPDVWRSRVVENGFAELPLIGPVRLSGLTIIEAQRAIQEASRQRQVFLRPTVSVAIAERRVHRVTVTGGVEAPGEYELPVGESNLMAALIASGGLSAAAGREVEIRGSAPSPAPGMLTSYQEDAVPRAAAHTRVDLFDAAARGTGDYPLADGAVVHVRKQPTRYVQVIGVIGNKQIEVPPNREFRLLDAIAQAGGPRYSPWVSNRITVIRQLPNSNKTITIRLSLRKAKHDGRENILLASGDVVSVDENAATFTLGTMQGLVGVGASAVTSAAALP